ncbi:glycerol-3-phosphate ABC transporter permease (plasmid) [Thermus thermophilus]|uniref:carbohydrate ABC transporter permease n=1 Tax=Thermus thermophilus TaxID=274 RepID=UPI001C79A314|nr:sugar ABC transporter permease [Thermus thermophilus]BCZ90637.1 glycerol-3-phosphate ABC transporter permease [Thermus thermophilus]BCZ93339.1 glycerol-3-phosphate ABC transporter permease [Thermus thermophilus]
MQRVRNVALSQRPSEAFGAYLFLLPALLPLLLFVYLPLAANLALSLTDWNLLRAEARFVGLENYLALFRDPAFSQVVGQSLIYMVLAALGNFLLPLGLAFLTQGVRGRWQEFYQSLLFLPTVAAVSVASLVWLYLYLPAAGPLAKLFAALGLGLPPLLADPRTALPAVALVANWKFLGFHYLIALAALKGLPREVLEAARVDGAQGLPLLRWVVLPLLGPVLLFLFLSALASALEYAFVPIEVMTQGGPFGRTSNLMYAVYQEAFRFFRTGVAAAEAVLLTLGLGILILGQLRLLEGRVRGAQG